MVPLRLAILSLPFIVATFVSAENPGDGLLPTPTLLDSMSIRESGQLEGPGTISRIDYFVRSRDGTGHITRLDMVSPSNSGTDSTVLLLDWTFPIPPIDIGDPIFSETPARTIYEDFHNGTPTGVDSSWSSWDATQKILVTTTTDQFSKCRWSDSSAFDAHDRLLSQYDCESDSVNDSTVVPLYYLYNAQYANATDSLPVREVSRDSSNGVISFGDSVSVWGNPNRPDSLLEGGMEGDLVKHFIRDSAGRLVQVTEYELGNSQLIGTETFTYDGQSRLILDIKPGNPGDTTQYLYAWSDATALRTRPSELRGFRLVGQNIEVSLPAPDRVRVDQLDLSGRVVENVADKTLPAGLSTIPLPSTSMGILRLRTSQGESDLMEPPR
jgi:hypothetical protein